LTTGCSIHKDYSGIEASCAPAIHNPGQTANPAATNHNPNLFIAFLTGRGKLLK
jgi:hypothetical protein